MKTTTQIQHLAKQYAKAKLMLSAGVTGAQLRKANQLLGGAKAGLEVLGVKYVEHADGSGIKIVE